MKKSAKKTLVGVSLLGICFAAVLGSTLALLKSQKTIGTVTATAAKIDVQSFEITYELDDIFQSAKPATGATGETIIYTYPTIAGDPLSTMAYVYEEQEFDVDGNAYSWLLGGTCKVAQNNDKTYSVEIEKMAAGDYVSFTLNAKVKTDVSAKYQFYFIPDTNNDFGNYISFNLENANTWQTLTAKNTTQDISAKCTISIPMGAELPAEGATHFGGTFAVVVVQGNAIPDATA